MKRIELKTTTTDDGGKLNYKDVLLQQLKMSPQGMSIEQMETALSLRQTLLHVNGFVIVEEADYKFIMERIDAVRWQVADSAVVQFVKDLKSAPTDDPNEIHKND